MTFNPVLTHFCTYPGSGGAGIAALRLVESLAPFLSKVELIGVPSQVVQHHPQVSALAYGHSLPEALWRRLRSWQCRRDQSAIEQPDAALAGFFSDRSAHGWSVANALQRAEIVHFHWANDLIDYTHVLRRIPPSVPIVWTLHDMSVFTGGCCYSFDCDHFQSDCGHCPQLASHRSDDFSARSLRRRLHALQSIRNRLQLIAPSSWMARMAASSRLFAGVPCAVIPNAVDLHSFTTERRKAGLYMTDLDPGKAIVLFVADSITNHRKGMATLLDALPSIQACCTIPIQLACIGSKPDTLPDGVRWLGQITEPHELASIFAAADLLVVPSIIDNAPNVIAEAHACGLPVLASDVGGIPEMITSGVNGMLVSASDSSSLSATVIQCLPNIVSNRNDWAARCRATAEDRYAPSHVADQHLQAYRRALSAVGPVRRGRSA